ncbi:MAG: hypothetical protein RI897_591 [Verrucomicrobiota bacterium]
MVGAVLGGDGDDGAFAGFDFFEVGEGFVEHAVIGDDENRWGAFVDHGDGPVFHFCGGIAFRMDVGDLLEFEGAFECYGEIELASQEEEILCLLVFQRDLLDLFIEREDFLHLLREGFEGSDPFHAASVGEHAEASHKQGDEGHDGDLCREGFR